MFFAAILAITLVPVDPAPAAVQVSVAHGGVIHSGSGTVIHCDGKCSIVLTNRHVCPSADGKIVVNVGGRKLPATWLGCDSKADLAAVKVDEKLPCVPLAKDTPPKGTPLRAWGYGGGNRTAKKGEAIGPKDNARTMDGAAVYFVNVHPIPGDSGCGLFCPLGRLVAVNWGGNREACCVGLPDIRRFIGQWCK